MPEERPTVQFGTAASEKLGLGYHLIPTASLRGLASIFAEGEAKYSTGAVNAKNIQPVVNNVAWQNERIDHALDHFLKFLEGDESEPHLLKVAWFCLMMAEVRRIEKAKAPTGGISAYQLKDVHGILNT